MGCGFCDVLVIDGDAGVRRAIEGVLREQGCRIYVAHDAAQALVVLRNIIPDLIVMGVVTRQMRELCEWLQHEPSLAAVPVAVFSASVEPPLRGGEPGVRTPPDRRTVLSLLESAASSSAAGRRPASNAERDPSAGGISGTYRRDDFPVLDSAPKRKRSK